MSYNNPIYPAKKEKLTNKFKHFDRSQANRKLKQRSYQKANETENKFIAKKAGERIFGRKQCVTQLITISLTTNRLFAYSLTVKEMRELIKL